MFTNVCTPFCTLSTVREIKVINKVIFEELPCLYQFNLVQRIL